MTVRYRPEHKAETRQKIVKDAAERIRAEGLQGAAVGAVMRDTGLTHGGFYKHFENKDELLAESLREAFREVAEALVRAAEHSPPGEAWKAVVRAYLTPEHCEHPERGCPLAALGPELARADKAMRSKIVEELANYKGRMLPLMPGRRAAEKERAFFAIFSAIVAPASAGMTPSRASTLASALSTSSILDRYCRPEKISVISASSNSEPNTWTSFYGLKNTVSPSPCRRISIR